MKEFLVYGLIDPETQQLRYVGKSSSGMERPKAHFEPANVRKRRHVYNWIRGLMARGIKPEILVLEEFDSHSGLYEAEQWYVAYFRFIGCRLTNLTDGGPGAVGAVRSSEQRRRISAALKGRVVGPPSPLHRARLRASNLGKTRSATTRLNMARSKGGRPFQDQYGRKFESIQEAGRMLGVPATEICAVLKGRRNQARGLRFAYLQADPHSKSTTLLSSGHGRVEESKSLIATISPEPDGGL